MGQPGHGCRLPQTEQLTIREELLGYHNNNHNIMGSRTVFLPATVMQELYWWWLLLFADCCRYISPPGWLSQWPRSICASMTLPAGTGAVSQSGLWTMIPYSSTRTPPHLLVSTCRTSASVSRQIWSARPVLPPMVLGLVPSVRWRPAWTTEFVSRVGMDTSTSETFSDIFYIYVLYFFIFIFLNIYNI